MSQTGLGKLPLELRQAIWKECLPDPATSSELYFYNHDDFGPYEASAGHDEPGCHAKFKVVIDYPVILHVCHEAREYAWKSHGISFQQFPRRIPEIRALPPLSHVLMPCRPYRPEADVFVYNEDDISDLWQMPDRQRNDPTGVFRRIRHFAIGSWQVHDIHISRYWLTMLCTLPSLRHVSIIFGLYWGFQPSSYSKVKAMREFRHFTLAPCTEESSWMQPDCEEEYDPGTNISNEVKVKDVMVRLREELSTIQAVDVDNAPWSEDGELGGWLFSFSAERMVSDASEFSRASRRF